MHGRLTIAFALTIVSLPAPARPRDDAMAVIEKAVQAFGGATVLDKYPAGRVQKKGIIVLQGAEVPYSSQGVYQLPDNVRIGFTTPLLAELTGNLLHRSDINVLKLPHATADRLAICSAVG